MSDVDFKNIEEAGAILRNIKSRYRKGLNNIIKIIGLSGTGKSYCSMELAIKISYMLHEKNNITVCNIVDSLLGLLKFLRQIKEPGEIVIIEEAEVLFPSRRAMAGDNLDIGKIFDTIRKKKVIVILNYPINRSIDSHVDALCTLQIETLKILKKEEVCIVKPLRLQTNPASGKVYFHRLNEGGKEIHRSFFNRPNKELTNMYESKKDQFLDNLYHELEQRQEERETKRIKRYGKVVMEGNVKDTELDAYTQVILNHMPVNDYAQLRGMGKRGVYHRIENFNRKTKFAKNNYPIDVKTATPPN